MSTFANNPVVLNYHDSILRRSDLRILAQDSEWLTDSIIGFYLQYLENDKYPSKWPEDGRNSNQDFLFIGPEVTQYLKLSNDDQSVSIFLTPLRAECYRLIFFPLNDSDQTTNASTNITSPSGSHWSLLVYFRDNKTFYHYDSLNAWNSSHASRLVDKLHNFLGGRKGFKHGKCLAQSNGYDCGIHVLCNVDNITDCATRLPHLNLDNLPAVSEDVVRSKRHALHSLVESLI